MVVSNNTTFPLSEFARLDLHRLVLGPPSHPYSRLRHSLRCLVHGRGKEKGRNGQNKITEESLVPLGGNKLIEMKRTMKNGLVDLGISRWPV